MYLKGLVGFCVVMLLMAGLAGCGSSRQAMKEQSAVASADKAGQTGQAAKAGDQKGLQGKDGAASTKSPGGTESAKLSAVSLKDVHFDYDKYLIKTEDTETLKQNSLWFKANPGKRVRIEGNCDERGTIEYNLALGQKRADAARGFLLTLGVDGKRMETVSYGKEKPLDPGTGEQAWAKNRRDHFEPLQ